MPEARLARASDLAGLLDLFRRSEVSSVAEPLSQAERIWSETMAHEGVAVFISEAGNTIAATCMLIVAPKPSPGRTRACVPRECRHPSRVSRSGAWPGGRRSSVGNGLGEGLPSCPDAERPERSACPSFLRELRLQTRNSNRLRRGSSRKKLTTLPCAAHHRSGFHPKQASDQEPSR